VAGTAAVLLLCLVRFLCLLWVVTPKLVRAVENVKEDEGRWMGDHTSTGFSSFISTSGWSSGVPLSGLDVSGWRMEGSCILATFVWGLDGFGVAFWVLSRWDLAGVRDVENAHRPSTPTLELFRPFFTISNRA
jgi:hypothetical protein